MREYVGLKIGTMKRDPHSDAVVDQEFSVQLIEIPASDIKSHKVIDILRLMNLTWPDDGTEKSVEEKVERFYNDHSEKIRYCFYQDKELVGYTESISLTIKIENNWLAVLGLGGLNVHPGWRRQGFGRVILEAVFKRIDASEYPYCLFQTGIPHFYEKLGCRLIENKFVNSNDPVDPSRNPFWDEYAMIYPATAIWPSGTVDLLRKGF